MKRTRFLCVVSTVALLAISVAACGDSDDDSAGGEGSAPAASEGVSQAQQKVAELRRPPEPLEIPALSKEPATGRSAYWISCQFTECALLDPGVNQATRALGWNLRTLTPELSPEAVAGAWSQAVGAKPDAIFALHVLPIEVIQAQLEQAEREGIAVVLIGPTAAAGEAGIDASLASSPFAEANGTAMADWAIADSDGQANMVLIYDESSPLHVVAADAAKREVRRLCDECEVDDLPVPTAEIGQGAPNEVVSYVQRNPDTGYVLAVGAASFALGISQALEGAGLSVKVATVASAPQNFDAVRKGAEAAALPVESTSLGWRMADAAVRVIEDDELPASLANPAGERQLFDETNIETAPRKGPWDVPDIEETFTRAWKKTG